MACMMTLDDGNQTYVLNGETGCVWCASLQKLWRMSSMFSLIVLLMLLLGSEVHILFSKAAQ